MRRLIIDASVAIKWAIAEDGSDLALTLKAHHRFLAPDLLIAECANILWKKVARGLITKDHALIALQVVTEAGISLAPTSVLMDSAVRIAIDLDHPAYDCFYLALAELEQLPLVTADDRLRAKFAGGRFDILSLDQALTR